MTSPFAQITDALVEAARRSVSPEEHERPACYSVMTKDAIRRWALAVGDDGFLRAMTVWQHRPLFLYDTMWLRGRVVSKNEAGASVRVKLWGDNQRGELISQGHATVALQRRSDKSSRVEGRWGRADSADEPHSQELGRPAWASI